MVMRDALADPYWRECVPQYAAQVNVLSPNIVSWRPVCPLPAAAGDSGANAPVTGIFFPAGKVCTNYNFAFAFLANPAYFGNQQELAL